MACLGLTILLCVRTVLGIMALRSTIHAFGLIEVGNKIHIQKRQIFNRENLESIARSYSLISCTEPKKLQSLYVPGQHQGLTK